jgi:hypothetical protein
VDDFLKADFSSVWPGVPSNLADQPLFHSRYARPVTA